MGEPTEFDIFQATVIKSKKDDPLKAKLPSGFGGSKGRRKGSELTYEELKEIDKNFQKKRMKTITVSKRFNVSTFFTLFQRLTFYFFTFEKIIFLIYTHFILIYLINAFFVFTRAVFVKIRGFLARNGISFDTHFIRGKSKAICILYVENRGNVW